MRNLLVPFGENVHTLLAVEVAPALVAQWDCSAHVLVVREPGTSLPTAEARLQKVREAMSSAGLNARLEVIPDKGVVEGILSRSRQADMILMGGRNADFMGLLFANSLTQEITERVACPVLWVKEYKETRSFWSVRFGDKQHDVGESHRAA